MERSRGFNSVQLKHYMNAGVPLSKERHHARREESSAERKLLVLPTILPDAFSLSSHGRKFSTRAESLERRQGGINHKKVSRGLEGGAE